MTSIYTTIAPIIFGTNVPISLQPLGYLDSIEKQEYLTLARQVFEEESINNYIKK